MNCPHCGGTDRHRSRRNQFERAFNWLFWYHQRPFRCTKCRTRYWVRLEPRVWRRGLRKEGVKVFRSWGLSLAAMALAALVAWIMSIARHQTLRGTVFEAALKQELRQRLDETDLSDQLKIKAEQFFDKR